MECYPCDNEWSWIWNYPSWARFYWAGPVIKALTPSRAPASIVTWGLVDRLVHRHEILHSMTSSHAVIEKRCRIGPKTMESSVLSHTAPPRSGRPNRTLELPSKCAAEAPPRRRSSERMWCCPSGCSIRTASESSTGCYVLNRKMTWAPKARTGVALLISTPDNSPGDSMLPLHKTPGSVRWEVLVSLSSYQRTYQGSHWTTVTAAMRAPWTLCVQGPTGRDNWP